MSKLYDLPQVSQTYFFPQPGAPLPTTERAGPVRLELPDGTPIGGFWSRPRKAAPTILYLHGNGECIADQLAHWPLWADRAGANIFFVDYPGYASSRGDPSLTTCCQAAMAALDYLLSRSRVEVVMVLLAGRSVGSIFALHAAARSSSPRLGGLMLESGIADLKPRLAMRVPYEQVGIDRAAIEAELDRDFDHRGTLKNISFPVLIMHTLHDGLVPADNSRLMARWAGQRLFRLVLFDIGDHNSIQLLNERAYQSHLAELVQAVYTAAND
jgi:pimeloyl-ACP methyl ester carboxylesterase